MIESRKLAGVSTSDSRDRAQAAAAPHFSPARWHRVLLFLVGVGFVAYGLLFVHRTSFKLDDGRRYYCLFDDAMISMRYGENLSHGSGAVWTPGERVEGYTSLLMMLVQAVASAVSDPVGAVLMVQLLGVATVLAIGATAYALAGQLLVVSDARTRIALQTAALVGCLAYYPLIYWSVMGMETGLFTLITLAAFYCVLSCDHGRRCWQQFALPLVLGLGYLTRPDFLPFAGLLLGMFTFERLKADHRLQQWAMPICAGAMLMSVVGVQLLVRLSYYGEWLPNTYTLKITGMPLSVRLAGGLGFVTPYLVQTAPLLLVAAAGALWTFNGRQMLAFGYALLLIAYQIFVGGDPWAHWRIMAPGFPLLFILTLQFGAKLGCVLSASTERFAISATGMVAVPIAVACLVWADYPFRDELLMRGPAFQVAANERNVRSAMILKELTDDSARLGVFWGGTIPYYADRPAVDILGKCDKRIAHMAPDLSGAIAWRGMSSVPGHNKYDLNYSLRQLKPDYIQGCRWGSQDLTDYASEEYEMLTFGPDVFYLLKDSPHVRWAQLPMLHERWNR